MGWTKVISVMFTFILIGMLIFYWFVPYGSIDFGIKDKNYNFSIDSTDESGMQFYKNLRYQYPEISYEIVDCPLQKRDNMLEAFNLVSENTMLTFQSSTNNPEIGVSCDSTTRINDGFFIAGEGGPVNITQTTNYNMISYGTVLLLKESSCGTPNIATHELLHALGFGHSSNQNNIMYNYSKCSQTVSPDIYNLINEIYSIESLPDLAFENVSANMHGKYLDTNVSIRNQGIINAVEINLKIYADNKLIKTFEIEEIDYGEGKKILLTNLWISKININELKYLLEYNYQELDKQNNQIILEIEN
jgi:hypothetical protein